MDAPLEFRTASSLQRAVIPQESEEVARSANPKNPGKDRVAAVAVDKINTCGSCEREGAKNRCSICKVVYYCNKVCQTGHWKIHRTVCPVMAVLAPDSLRFQEMEKALLELQVLASNALRYAAEAKNLVISSSNSAYRDDTQINSAIWKMTESRDLLKEKARTVGLQYGVSQFTLDRIKKKHGNNGIVTLLTIGHGIKKKNLEIKYDHKSDKIIVLNSSNLELSEIKKIIYNQTDKYQILLPVVETNRKANGNIQIMWEYGGSNYYKEVLAYLEEEGSDAQTVDKVREALRKKKNQNAYLRGY